MRHSKIILILLALFLSALISGCAGTSSRVTAPAPDNYDPVLLFNSRLGNMIEQLSNSQKFTPGEFSPISVIPGSIRSGGDFTRLEEYIIEKLERELRKDHELYNLSRNNWMEFRERRPLGFDDQPEPMKKLLENLILFEVKVSPEKLLEQINVTILATDSKGNSIPGFGEDVSLDFSQGSPAYKLYQEIPLSTVFPEGLEERPYTSIDRLTFSLADELRRNFKRGFLLEGDDIDEKEINVLLYPKSGAPLPGNIFDLIVNSMQQAIVNEDGFKCALSREDFSSVLDQVNFYDKNAGVFDIEKYPLSTGTVMLIMDISPHKDNNKLGVALRSLWRTQPLETDNGKLIFTNLAGAYVSGFTARAYLSVDSGYFWQSNGKRPWNEKQIYEDSGFE